MLVDLVDNFVSSVISCTMASGDCWMSSSVPAEWEFRIDSFAPYSTMHNGKTPKLVAHIKSEGVDRPSAFLFV